MDAGNQTERRKSVRTRQGLEALSAEYKGMSTIWKAVSLAVGSSGVAYYFGVESRSIWPLALSGIGFLGAGSIGVYYSIAAERVASQLKNFPRQDDSQPLNASVLEGIIKKEGTYNN